MANKPDNARIVAEVVFNLVTTGGAAVATTSGVPLPLVLLGKGILGCTFKLLLANLSGQPDPKQILARIQNERTATTIETIRDALVEAMELKPDFTEPINELADAVEGKDQERLAQALFKLFTSLTQVTARLEAIKTDTTVIREDTSVLREGMKEVKAALGVSGPPQSESLTGQSYLRTQLEAVSDDLRALLDAQGRKLWDELNAALAERSWQKAFDLSAQLEQWLDDQGEKVSSDIKGQALLSLADVTVIRDSGMPFETRCETREAWRLLNKAGAVLGSSPNEENAQRLLRVRAKLTFIDGDRKAASKLLAKTHGPGTISMQIAFLQEQDQWADASDLAQAQHTPDKKWADDAIVAHLRAGQRERADELLEWAKTQDVTVQKNCVLAFTRTLYSEITGEGTPDILLGLDQQARSRLDGLQEQLADTFASAFMDGPSSGVEAEALEVAILLGHVQHDKQACQAAADRLVAWKPLSLEMGRGVLRGDIVPIDGLADRFLGEHGSVFMTQIMAAMLLTEVEENAERALGVLQPLLDEDDLGRKEKVAISILIAAQYCEEAKIEEAQAWLDQALGASHRLSTMLRAVLRAKQGNLHEADSELTKVVDRQDYIWLQLSAGLAAQREDWSTAAEASRRLGELTGRVEAFQNEAQAWHHSGDVSKVIEPLEKAHQLAPDHAPTIRNLVAAYHHMGRYGDAAKKYEVLWQTDSHTKYLAVNYANCLALDGKATDAIDVLADYIDGAGDETEIEPLLMCAQLLQSQDKAGDALDALLPRWDKFSDNYQYLMAVMQLGYASNREDNANRAFENLIGMHKEGALPNGVLWEFTLDDIPDMHRDWQERRKYINEKYLSGQLPWLVASQWLQPSNHCYLSWLMRTQALIPSDHPESLAEYSVYSTNGFTDAEQDGQRHLVRLVAPTADAEVVADISGLITLHRLGLLKNLGRYFNKVFLPQSYKKIWLEERTRIPHHQPRQIESRRAILKAVRDEKITVASGTANDECPVLDEYEKDTSDSPVFVRILQVAKWLARMGRIPGSTLAVVESKQNQPGIISDEQASDALEGGRLIAKPFTLQTVYDYGLLDLLCNGLRVSIEEAELRQLEGELRGQEASDEAGQWHRDLVAAVGTVPNLEFVHLDVGDKKDEPDRTQIRYGIDAALLSKQLGLPLLVDDRYCQQGLLGASDAGPSAAFGTDVLVARLAKDGVITPDQQADYALQLIRWRYKFLIPPVDVLLTMASRFKDGLPGTQLREVAVYMQDCMRDFGLYGGQEQVDPPISMAMRVFKAWIDSVAAFVVDLWWDDRFSEEQAARFTRWAARYLLPAWPRNMGAPVWRRIAYVRRYTLLGGIFTNLLQKEDVRKANRVVNRVRRSIGVTEEELASAAEFVSDTMGSVLDEHGEQIVGSIFIRILDIVYGCRSAISWRLLPMAERLGLVDLSKQVQDVSDEYVSVIEDRNHSNRFAPKVGPFAYTLDGKHAIVSFLPDAICMAHTRLRRAVLDNLVPQGYCPKTANTQAALQCETDNIRAESSGTWVPAVSRVLEQLKEDFVLNMAGFSQAQQRQHNDGCLLCWGHLIRPTAESLLSIDSDGWKLLSHGDEQEDTLKALLKDAASLSDMLLRYDQLVGHLTLAAPLDLGSQVRNYVEKNGSREDVWPAMRKWLQDKSEPWRRYHACQTLLSNCEYIPNGCQSEFWGTVSEMVELSLVDNRDSDEAQVWRLESELAGHYLRTVDLGGYGLEANRPLAVSWWAAKHVTNLLTRSLPTDAVPDQVRKWRADPVLQGTLLARDAWAWLSLKVYSPCRFATLYENSPRSVAVLIALGDFAKENGLDSVPPDVRARLRDCFCAALLTTDTAPASKDMCVWMWDHSLLEAAKTFISSLPSEEQTDSTVQTCRVVERLNGTKTLGEAMKQLATTNEMDAIFVCSRARLYCYVHADAADMMLDLLRNSEWRDACALKVPVLGWELLAQGLLFLQSRQGIDWFVELPYVFLRLTEASSSDKEKAEFFLTYLVMSSLAGNTAGALKSLGKSSQLPSLRPAISIVRKAIENLKIASHPDVAIRFQGLLTMLEQFSCDATHTLSASTLRE